MFVKKKKKDDCLRGLGYFCFIFVFLVLRDGDRLGFVNF